MPPSRAVSAMILLPVPAWKLPTVTTAESVGLTRRETRLCRVQTIWLPMSTASMPREGEAPWVPRP